MNTRKLLIAFFLISILLTACGGSETAAPTEEPTEIVAAVDPCSEANLPGEVGKVNDLMREFDDYATLASNTPQTQLVVVVPELQRVQRAAEDLEVPACLYRLKELQISHMSLVVQTLLAFMSSSDANMVNAGIAQARDIRTQYDIEIARLLGVTLVSSTPVPTP